MKNMRKYLGIRRIHLLYQRIYINFRDLYLGIKEDISVLKGNGPNRLIEGMFGAK